ncbi:hypothetical protein TorRG33x02_140730, partial [Trema orientale]
DQKNSDIVEDKRVDSKGKEKKKVDSKIPHILNYFCNVCPYFEEFEKNVLEADKISIPNVFSIVEEITKYRLNELPKRVQQPILESLRNVVAAHNGDDDFSDNPSKVPAPPKAEVPDVDTIANDVITLDFIHDDDLLAVEGVDSVNEHKDAVKDGEEEEKNAEESKEEEKEDKENGNDDKDEEKHEKNDKDDKDDPD